MTDASDKPDFEALRARRNEQVRKVIDETAASLGVEPGKVVHNFDPDACYCDCPRGPCEHDFQGWRDFEDGSGGESICKRCGMGAMSHCLRTAE